MSKEVSTPSGEYKLTRRGKVATILAACALAPFAAEGATRTVDAMHAEVVCSEDTHSTAVNNGQGFESVLAHDNHLNYPDGTVKEVVIHVKQINQEAITLPLTPGQELEVPNQCYIE